MTICAAEKKGGGVMNISNISSSLDLSAVLNLTTSKPLARMDAAPAQLYPHGNNSGNFVFLKQAYSPNRDSFLHLVTNRQQVMPATTTESIALGQFTKIQWIPTLQIENGFVAPTPVIGHSCIRMDRYR